MHPFSGLGLGTTTDDQYPGETHGLCKRTDIYGYGCEAPDIRGYPGENYLIRHK